MSNDIAVLGSGRMGSSIIRELIFEAPSLQNRIIAYDRNENKINDLKKMGIKVTQDKIIAINYSRIIIIAIRPQQVKDFIEEIKTIINPKHIIISIAIGVPIKWLSQSLNNNNIFHIHPPSTIMAYSKGISFACSTPNLNLEIRNEVEDIFLNLGDLKWVKEKEIEEYAILAGCSPAFFCFFLERWKEMSIEIGIKSEVIDMIIDKMFKAIQYGITEKNLSFLEIIDNITTPNGVTKEGLKKMETLDSIFKDVYNSGFAKIESIKKLYR